jgi:hypothetical protein
MPVPFQNPNLQREKLLANFPTKGAQMKRIKKLQGRIDRVEAEVAKLEKRKLRIPDEHKAGMARKIQKIRDETSVWRNECFMLRELASCVEGHSRA